MLANLFINVFNNFILIWYRNWFYILYKIISHIFIGCYIQFISFLTTLEVNSKVLLFPLHRGTIINSFVSNKVFYVKETKQDPNFLTHTFSVSSWWRPSKWESSLYVPKTLWVDRPIKFKLFKKFIIYYQETRKYGVTFTGLTFTKHKAIKITM